MATNPSSFGQKNEAGSETELFLKVFSGEVLTSFEEHTVMMPLHMQRTISSGKSAQFPIVGRATAGFHLSGQNLLTDTATDAGWGLNTNAGGGFSAGNIKSGFGENYQYAQKVEHEEKVIFIDRPLVSHIFVDSLDEMMNHYDIRSIYAAELGRALATAFDQQAIMSGIIGATTAHQLNLTGVTNGGSIVDADFETNGASTADTIMQAAQKFDENEVPKEGRHIALRPAAFYRLLKQTDLITTEINPPNGSLKEGVIRKAFGVAIHSTNQIPTANLSAVTLVGANNTYGADFSNSVALAWHETAIGTVKLMDLTMESERKIEYQGNMMVAKFAKGTHWLRPEALIQIKTA